MNFIDRILRHARITRQDFQDLPSPPFLILFINSICNQKGEHCFYWRNLNSRRVPVRRNISGSMSMSGGCGFSEKRDVLAPLSNPFFSGRNPGRLPCKSRWSDVARACSVM
jgi:hypothetical protein